MPDTNHNWEMRPNGHAPEHGQSTPPAPPIAGLPYYHSPTEPWLADGLDLGAILHVVWSKRLAIGIATAVALVSAVFYILVATRVYEAKSIIELSLRRPRILGQQEAVISDAGSVSASEVLNTQMIKLQGPSLRREVLHQLRTWSPKLLPSPDPEKMMKYLERHVRIEMVRRSSLVRITARTHDPELSTRIANLYANVAVNHAISLNKEASDNAVVWLQMQAKAQGTLLDKAEEELLKFRKENDIEVMESQRKMSEEAMLTFGDEQTKTIAARDAAMARYTDKHPEVRTLDQVIEATRKQFETEVQRAKELDQRIAESKSKLNALQRQIEACEMSYKGILNRMEEARLSADEKTATIKVAELAELPTAPVKPRKLLILFMSLVLGPAAGIAFAFTAHKLENRVWSGDEVAAETGLKLLGAVPHSETQERDSLALAVLTDKFSAVAESFSAVRGILDASKQYKTLVVTSSAAEEGKTICSCNLAISSAQSGLRTLLVDLDLRRPRIRRVFNIPTTNLASFQSLILAERESPDYDSLPAKTQVSGLDLVATLPTDASPAQVLSSKRMQGFIAWAAAHYDRVILDSPPVGVASDSMMLGSVVDGVILVCRFNRSRKNMVRSAARRLQDCGAIIVGLVVNDVVLTKLNLYYDHHYHGGYHAAPDEAPTTGDGKPHKPGT